MVTTAVRNARAAKVRHPSAGSVTGSAVGSLIVSRPREATQEFVYSVHVDKPDHMGAVEILFKSKQDACAYAEDRSRDFRILSASVTCFTVGELGTRRPVAWYVDGQQQPQWFDRQLYPVDGNRHQAKS